MDLKDIKIGRLYKKIEKLKQQRDHYKEKCTHYKTVFEESPFVEPRYNRYVLRIGEVQHEKELRRKLEIRVFEQEQLIKRLLEEQCQKSV